MLFPFNASSFYNSIAFTSQTMIVWENYEYFLICQWHTRSKQLMHKQQRWMPRTLRVIRIQHQHTMNVRSHCIGQANDPWRNREKITRANCALLFFGKWENWTIKKNTLNRDELFKLCPYSRCTKKSFSSSHFTTGEFFEPSIIFTRWFFNSLLSDSWFALHNLREALFVVYMSFAHKRLTEM